MNIDNLLIKNYGCVTSYEHELIRSMRNHPVVRACMYNDHIITADMHQRFLDKITDDNTQYHYLVQDADSGMYYGAINIVQISFEHQRGSLGIFANQECPVPGVGKILMKALCDVAFKKLHLWSLRSEVFTDNDRAISLYEKFGFIQEGIMRSYIYRKTENQWKDVLVMSLLRNEYACLE